MGDGEERARGLVVFLKIKEDRLIDILVGRFGLEIYVDILQVIL